MWVMIMVVCSIEFVLLCYQPSHMIHRVIQQTIVQVVWQPVTCLTFMMRPNMEWFASGWLYPHTNNCNNTGSQQSDVQQQAQ
jgi:hypothetical protein